MRCFTDSLTKITANWSRALFRPVLSCKFLCAASALALLTGGVFAQETPETALSERPVLRASLAQNYAVSEHRRKQALKTARAAARHARAEAAIAAKTYSAARAIWMGLAESGDPQAVKRLADMHRFGLGSVVDEAKAYRLYKLGAEAGHASAQHALGLMLLRGKGAPQDPRAAALWLRRAADKGLASARFSLGLLKEHGVGVDMDIESARSLYGAAAQAGHVSAAARLSSLPPRAPSVVAELAGVRDLRRRAQPVSSSSAVMVRGAGLAMRGQALAAAMGASSKIARSAGGAPTGSTSQKPYAADQTPPSASAAQRLSAAQPAPRRAPPQPAAFVRMTPPYQPFNAVRAEVSAPALTLRGQRLATSLPPKVLSPSGKPPASPAFAAPALAPDVENTAPARWALYGMFARAAEALSEQGVVFDHKSAAPPKIAPPPEAYASIARTGDVVMVKPESRLIAAPQIAAAPASMARVALKQGRSPQLQAVRDRDERVAASARISPLRRDLGRISDPEVVLASPQFARAPSAAAKVPQPAHFIRQPKPSHAPVLAIHRSVPAEAIVVARPARAPKAWRAPHGDPVLQRKSVSMHSRAVIADDLYRMRRYRQAAEIWRKMRRQGDPRSAFLLGRLHSRGEGVRRDRVRAYHLWREAADGGYSRARTALANLVARLTPSEMHKIRRRESASCSAENCGAPSVMAR